MAISLPDTELTDFQYIAAHELFAPTDTEVSRQDMARFVLDAYQEASIERNEDLDAMMIGDMYRFLSISIDQLVALADQHKIGSLAEKTLGGVLKETHEQIDNAIERARDFEGVTPSKLLVGTGHILLKDSVAGEIRKTGAPYETHPFRVAAMGFAIARQLRREGLRDDPELTEAEIILRFFHDSAEETMPAGKHYNPDRTGHFSPLLTDRLLARFDNPYGRETADSLRYITHIKGSTWTRSWLDYVFQRTMQTRMACEAKHDDVFDNLKNEPKPVFTEEQRRTRYRKEGEYTIALPLLRARAIELAEPAEKVWVTRAQEIRATMEPGLQADKVAELEEYIYEEAA